MLPREVCYTDLNSHTDCYRNLFIAYTLSDYQVHLQSGCMHQHVFVCVCTCIFDAFSGPYYGRQQHLLTPRGHVSGGILTALLSNSLVYLYVVAVCVNLTMDYQYL